MKNKELDYIKRTIENKIVITEESLKGILKKTLENYKDSKFNYLLMELYENNILYKLNNGVFKPCCNRKKFSLQINLSDNLIEEFNEITPPITISVYNTSIFNDFTSLQLLKNYTVVETYEYSIEIVLESLLKANAKGVYASDFHTLLKYNNSEEYYVIKKINDDSPIIKKNKKNNETIITTPKLEKILIDALVDPYYKLLLSSEIINIYRHVLSQYQVNLVTLFRYAKKKYCYEKLNNLLNYINFDISKGEFK